MPAWVAFAITYILKIVGESFKNTLNLYQLITDRLADCGFSLFIALESDNEKAKEWLLEKYYNWLRIAIHACPAHFFIIYNYDVIKADDDLKRFLQSDPYLAKWWTVISESFEKNYRTSDLLEFLKHALIDTPLSFIFGVIDLILNNPATLAEEVSASVLSAINATPESEDTAITNYLSRFKPDKVPDSFLIISNEIIIKLNPFLAFLSPQIMAHIKAMYAYSKIIHLKPCPQPPRQLLDFLDCDVYVDGKHYATIKLSEDNTLAITIPKSALKPNVWHNICFDYAGLVKCVKYRYTIPLNLVLTAYGYQGYYACNVNNTFSQGQDMTDWVGDSRINCNTFYGDSYSLMWWEMEHNMESEPFYIRVYVGAYREACYGTATLYVGYREGNTLYLTPITSIPYTWTNPGQITLYGRFPSPRFVLALYHYCYRPPLSVTGVRLIRQQAWVE